MLPDRKAIGERLRLARQARGWSLREFAERINQAYQTVAAWEVGRTMPSPEILGYAAQVLGVSLDWLVYGTPERARLPPGRLPTLLLDRAQRLRADANLLQEMAARLTADADALTRADQVLEQTGYLPEAQIERLAEILSRPLAAWGTRPIGPRDLAAIIRAELEG